jgi:hypothetical protein
VVRTRHSPSWLSINWDETRGSCHEQSERKHRMSRKLTAFSIESEGRAARWLAAWDGHGVHRTATAGDDAGAEWLAAEARALGAAVTIEEFAVDRLDPITAFLEIGDERIDAVPVFDAPATDSTGVTGRLGLAGDEGGIVVAELSVRAVYSGELKSLRRDGMHSGFVVVCSGDAPGIGLINAEDYRSPYGAPAIHVSSEARDFVFAAVARHAPARLVAESRRVRAQGRNTVVELPGAEPSKAPLIVMTPRSSWWQSVSERGGGIVCWLESLRALLAASPNRPVIFTSNTGHELGLLGLDDFISRRRGWTQRDGRATWLLFGANIGAVGSTLSVMSPANDLRDLIATELTQVGLPHAIAPKERVPNGETRDLHRVGAHCVAINSTENRVFHLPQDRWPKAVDVPAIARCAAAGARVVRALAL